MKNIIIQQQNGSNAKEKLKREKEANEINIEQLEHYCQQCSRRVEGGRKE